MKKAFYVVVGALALALALGCVAWASDTPASEGSQDAVGQSVDTVSGQVYGVPVLFVIGQSSYSVGDAVYQSDAAPFIENGRTYVPVRYLGDAIGAKIEWDGATGTVTLTKDATIVKVVVGNSDILVNDKSTPMDVAPILKDGRTYLPVRYLAEAFGYTVEWDQALQTVRIK